MHVVNCCIWPGQIPSGNAIWPTCSNKYPGILVKLNIQADVREMEGFCLKIGEMWTTHSRQTAGRPHMTEYITCSMFCSFGNVSWEKCTQNSLLFGIFALEMSWLCYARMSGIPLFVLKHTVCFLAFSHFSSDSVISNPTSGRVLYRWSPLDFQFAVLWLLQAAVL